MERMDITLLEKVKYMPDASCMPKKFWAEALSIAGYLISRTPSFAINFNIHEHVWCGRKPLYSFLRKFGCLVYSHIIQVKLETRAIRCVVGEYPCGIKGYWLWSIMLNTKAGKK